MRDWKSLIRERLEPLRMKPGGEADFIEELAQHLEDCYRESLSGGASEEEAYQTTISELEDMYPLAAEIERHEQMPRYDAVPAGDAGMGNWVEDAWRDVRYAIRTLRKSPIFVLFAVLTLGLGIGANTTVFTVINTLILNPLPVPNTAELDAVAASDLKKTSKSSGDISDFVRGSERLPGEECSLSVTGGLYLSPRGDVAAVGWLRAYVQRVGDGQLFLDSWPDARQRTVLSSGGRRHSRDERRGCDELRNMAGPVSAGRPISSGKTLRLNRLSSP